MKFHHPFQICRALRSVDHYLPADVHYSPVPSLPLCARPRWWERYPLVIGPRGTAWEQQPLSRSAVPLRASCQVEVTNYFPSPFAPITCVPPPLHFDCCSVTLGSDRNSQHRKRFKQSFRKYQWLLTHAFWWRAVVYLKQQYPHNTPNLHSGASCRQWEGKCKSSQAAPTDGISMWAISDEEPDDILCGCAGETAGKQSV